MKINEINEKQWISINKQWTIKIEIETNRNRNRFEVKNRICFRSASPPRPIREPKLGENKLWNQTGHRSKFVSKILQNFRKINQNRRQNDPTSRSGGGLGGSWSLSGRLCRVLGHIVCVLRRLGCLLERLGGALGGVLGASWGLLGVSWGNFKRPLGHPGAYWRVLKHLGVVLGSIFEATLQHIISDAIF